ncbi:hypothetical protein [Christensenella intestinihominis]|uniref:hypothetical protein n=1 Tax=Christensenella intestinihominis TaxID=1851429 RepID=UPI0008312E47|nr:hypothetical protein [Christensenella intestinihominis]
MKKGLVFALCVIMTCGLLVAGCSNNTGIDTVEIDSLPYSIPYYKDSTIDLVSLDMCQREYDNHGKTTYQVEVLLTIDVSSILQLSDNDKYWADRDVEVAPFECSIYCYDNGLSFDDLKYVNTYEDDSTGYRYIQFTTDGLEEYFNDFSGSKISIRSFTDMGDAEKPNESKERKMYAYTTDEFEELPDILPQEELLQSLM